MVKISGLQYRGDPSALAGALLCGVEHEMSAVVFFDREGECLCAELFDTRYRAPVSVPPDGACCAWLLSNHPFDRGDPFEQDMDNLRRLVFALGRKQVRFLITGQEAGCREMDVVTYFERNAEFPWKRC